MINVNRNVTQHSRKNIFKAFVFLQSFTAIE